jgi:hypothetical protein
MVARDESQRVHVVVAGKSGMFEKNLFKRLFGNFQILFSLEIY